jgi:hypothetical protein
MPQDIADMFCSTSICEVVQDSAGAMRYPIGLSTCNSLAISYINSSSSVGRLLMTHVEQPTIVGQVSRRDFLAGDRGA